MAAHPSRLPGEAAQSADTRCPRCGVAFHCGVHDATPCACAAIPLDAALLARLRAQYVGCLCPECLRALAGPAGAAAA